MKLKPWQKRKPVYRTQLSLVSLVRHGGNCLSVATVTFFSRLGQNVELQRASARLSPQQWTDSFNNHLKPGLEKVAYNPCNIWNEDESGIFPQFTTVGQRVWVRRGRKTVARRRGWQRQHITTIVAVNAQGQATKPALLWKTKK